jgi:uncharacterized protein (TIGR03437 family)
MKRVLPLLTLMLLISIGAQAQISTTLTVNATATISLTSGAFSATGTATLPGVGPGTGTFAATLNASAITGTTVAVPFTITMSTGTLTGNITVPATLFLGSSNTGSGSGTITGGTGAFAGATGTFPTLSGTASGSIATSLTLTFAGAGTVTIGGGGGPTTSTPAITDVLDAASYTRGVARGSIFVVKGTNLSAAGFTQLSFPLPTTSGGVRVSFTPLAGGSSTDAYLVYLFNQNNVNQLAAILPSTVAAGAYNVTVTTSNGTSAVFATQVVARKPGIITQDSTGNGLAVVQNFVSATQLDVDRFTTQTLSGITVSPSKPGQVLIAWMTGMGALPSGADNTASAAVDFLASARIRAVVGGMEITPLYAGRAPGLAGADQVNFVLPANVPTGCTVPFQVSIDGQLSNATFVAIAPNAAATECVQPGFTATQLRNFDQGGSYSLGAFSLTQVSTTVPQLGTVKLNTAGGTFTKVTGFQLSSAAGGQTQGIATDSCIVTRITGTQSQLGVPTGTAIGLDAGNITLTGPAGSNITNGVALNKEPASFIYSLSLGTEGIPSLPGAVNATLVAGQYRLAGAGGRDVGAFNAAVNLGAPLTITGGLPATVVRASGLPLAWSGGNATDLVVITGYAGTTSGTGASATVDATQFVCTTTAGRGGFTVSPDVLNQLPAITAAQIASGAGTGYLVVSTSVTPTTGNGLFTAPLVAGGSIDTGVFIGSVGVASTPAYQ